MDRILPSLYVESTIPSYATARDSLDRIRFHRQIVTRVFWENERNKFRLFISRTVVDECRRGDPEAARLRIKFIEDIELLKETDHVRELSLIYQQLLSIPERAENDSLHLAVCVANKIDLLLTWNCTHLGPMAQKRMQTYNDRNGLWTPVLATPDTINEVILKGGV